MHNLILKTGTHWVEPMLKLHFCTRLIPINGEDSDPSREALPRCKAMNRVHTRVAVLVAPTVVYSRYLKQNLDQSR